MTTEDKILEMLIAIQKDVKAIKGDLEELKDAHEKTRSGVNSLLEWAEECGNIIKFPLPRVK